jgi:hypothetical protein
LPLHPLRIGVNFIVDFVALGALPIALMFRIEGLAAFIAFYEFDYFRQIIGGLAFFPVPLHPIANGFL